MLYTVTSFHGNEGSQKGKETKLVQQNVFTGGSEIHCCSKAEFLSSGKKNSVHQLLFVGLLPWTFVMLLCAFWHFEEKFVFAVAIISLSLLTLYMHFWKVVTESLLVVRGLGIQITWTYFTGRRVSEFYPVSCTGDILLKQTVTVHNVLSFIGIIMSSANGKFQLKPIGSLYYENQQLLSICNDILDVLNK